MMMKHDDDDEHSCCLGLVLSFNLSNLCVTVYTLPHH